MPHIHEKIDFCAEVFVVYNNKVLLRKHDKLNIWLSVGGHVELDEDPSQAAVREVKEEVGLDVELINTSEYAIKGDGMITPPTWMNRHSITKTHEHVAMVYVATSKTDQLSLSKIEVTEACKWCSKEDLKQMDLKPNIRKCAEYALEIVK
jgi:8-oxo-dGTP pyrophosphatase MutT (NUDIX family)